MFLKKLDLFPYNPQLAVENEDVGHRTRLGGFISILIGILLLLAMYAFGNEIVVKSKPISLMSEYFVKAPKLEGKDLFITFSVGKSGGIAIPNIDRFITIKWGFIDIDSTRDESIIYGSYPATRCVDSSKYFNDVENNFELQSFLIQDPEEHVCIGPEMKNYTLRGEYGATDFFSYDVRLFKCINSTENGNICAPEEEIKEQFMDLFIFAYFSHIIVNPLDLHTPILDTYFSFISPLSLGFSRQDIIKFQLVEFLSDEAFLLEEYKVTNSFEFKEKISDIKIGDNPQFYRGLYSLYNLKKKISRNYIKIKKVAADVGGIISFFFHFVQLTIKFVTKISFIKYFQKYLYEELKEYENDDSNLKNLKVKKPTHVAYYESFRLLSAQKLPTLNKLKQKSKNGIIKKDDGEKKEVDNTNEKNIPSSSYNRLKNNEISNSNISPEKINDNVLSLNKYNLTSKNKEIEETPKIIPKNIKTLKVDLAPVLKGKEEESNRLRNNYPNDLQRLGFNKAIFNSHSYFIKDLIDYYFLKNANNKILHNIDSYFGSEYSLENLFNNYSKITLLENFYNEESKESAENKFLFKISKNMNLLIKSDDWRKEDNIKKL